MPCAKQVGQLAWLKREHLELRQNKKAHSIWKQGLVSEGEYRAAVRICREKTRKAKAVLELMLSSVV